MNQDTIGLVIFALTALGAVYAFIFVLGGPAATGQFSAEPAVSYFQQRTAEAACANAHDCHDGLAGVPTGVFDAERELYECKCQKSNPHFTFYRSRYSRQLSSRS